jgi:colanic acid/amylovoran biosynthesis glycosyltransferase
MKIAYVVSGMKMPFVINEIEAHEKAGWQILPLASCKREQFEGWSEVMIKWCRRTIYRPSVLVQIWMTLREMFTHPLRLCRVYLWMFTLLFRCPSEFVKSIYEFTTVCDFARYCRRFDAEHIHVHFASRSLSLGVMLAMLTNLSVSCTVHAFDIFTRNANSLRPRLVKCKFIASISQFNIEHLRETCGESVADLCRIVHCGIDVERFKSVSQRPQPGRMVCIARLERKKGLDVAIETCTKLKERNVDFSFQVIGDGPEREHLEQQICRLGLQGRVELLGLKANDQLVPFFSQACLFFMPCVKTENGDMDGIPVAMMEAMACEVPVISTRISGIPELVQHNVNGFLVDMKSEGRKTKDPRFRGDRLAPAEAGGRPSSIIHRPSLIGILAETIENLLSDPDRIRRFGRAARRQVEQNFNITKTAAQLRQLIQE